MSATESGTPGGSFATRSRSCAVRWRVHSACCSACGRCVEGTRAAWGVLHAISVAFSCCHMQLVVYAYTCAQHLHSRRCQQPAKSGTPGGSVATRSRFCAVRLQVRSACCSACTPDLRTSARRPSKYRTRGNARTHVWRCSPRCHAVVLRECNAALPLHLHAVIGSDMRVGCVRDLRDVQFRSARSVRLLSAAVVHAAFVVASSCAHWRTCPQLAHDPALCASDAVPVVLRMVALFTACVTVSSARQEEGRGERWCMPALRYARGLHSSKSHS